MMDWRDPSEQGTIAGQKVHLETAHIGPFEPGSARLTRELKNQVEMVKAISPYFKVWVFTHGGVKEIVLTGWANTSGNTDREDDLLAYQRALSVNSRMEAFLPDPLPITATRAGRQNITPEEKYQRVVVEVVTHEDTIKQNVAAHEFGHVLADLGDEYVNPYKDRLPGDKPAHYERVKEQLGAAAADELLVGNTASIMSGDDVVKPGHYVKFVEVMRRMTGMRWKVR